MTNSDGKVEQRRSSGVVRRGFEAVQNQFDAYLLSDPRYSAQLAIFWKDDLVVDLVGGPDLAADSVTGVFSVTKGISAMVLSTLVRSGELDLDKAVAHYWPQFARHGKGSVLVRELLSHQAGVLGVHGGFQLEELLNSESAASRLAEERPMWRPGSAFGYHSLTLGVCMEELVRRIAGTTLQELYESVVRGPRTIDFYLGFPNQQESRYRPVLPMVPNAEQAAEISRRATPPDGITAFMSNAVNSDPMADERTITPNSRAVRAAGPAAFGGVGSAKGIAQAYAACIGYFGEPLLDVETNEAMSQQQSWGIDRSFGIENCFGVVYMRPMPRMEFGSYRAFGHDGAGGGLGFADPTYELSFGYIPAPMSYPGGADSKSLHLSAIARRCLLQLA